MISRGTILTVVLAGDYGKPRPALVVQSDLALDIPSVVVCPLTTDLRNSAPEIRIPLEPSEQNGLRRSSIIMIDKLSALDRNRIGEIIGTIEPRVMTHVSRALAIFLGIV